MIPKTIEREHIIAALAEIDRCGVPPGRQAAKFMVVYKEKKYPPKFVLSLAVKCAMGTQLPPDSFGGGKEANGFLRERGSRHFLTLQDASTLYDEDREGPRVFARSEARTEL